MPTRTTAPHGAPCWVDLMTSDAARSRAFYTALFGWTAEPPNAEFGGYFNFSKGDARVGGCMERQPGMEGPDAWSVYLATDDAAKTLEAAAAYGGQVTVEAMPVADLGTMGFLVDPGGAGVGIWQPGAHPGFAVLAEPGAPSWFELMTRDYANVLDFYRNVFSWDTEPVSDGDSAYTVMKADDQWLAGVADAATSLPEGSPSSWAVYFGVDDTDASVARALELGGTVVVPAEDTPYGRIATLADPTGAKFQIVAANEDMPANG